MNHTVAVKPRTSLYFDPEAIRSVIYDLLCGLYNMLAIYSLSGPIYECLTWMRGKRHRVNAHAVTAHVSLSVPTVTTRTSNSIPDWL